MSRTTSLVAATVAAGSLTLAYSLWEARQFTLRKATVPVLPSDCSPIRVLHISDLHFTPTQTAKADWVKALVELEPDVVVNTGDNLAHLDAVPTVLDALEPLLDIPGVFVMGSNDYYAPIFKNPLGYLAPGPARLVRGAPLPTDDLANGLASAGWLNANNARGIVKAGDVSLEFVGVDDPHIFRDRYEAVAGPLDESVTMSIGITHAPYRRVLDAMTADGLPFVVAGHTHGGQVCVPGYGALTTNCDLPARQAKGLSRYDDAWLHVSAGLGCSPYAPIRLACRPEASLLTLVPADSAETRPPG